MLTVVPALSSEPATETSKARRARGRGVATWIAVGLLVASGAWWSAGSERRAVRRLDGPTRATLVSRALTDLRSSCEGEKAPTDWCRKQADFVLLFDECDTGCRATAHEVLRSPTR